MPELAAAPRIQDWIGRTAAAEDVLALRPANLLASILSAPPALGVGGPLPPLWHWLYFPDLVPLDQCGEDGHPSRGDFLPPVALPRRMWAGGELRFHGDLRVGESVRRVSRIVDVAEKIGASGALCFVTVEHQMFVDGDLRIEERQAIVYRGALRTPVPSAAKIPLAEAGRRETVTPTPTMLFRFSAATTNSHRIHYDRDYARDREHYEGLVVHGPLLAIFLADLARRASGREIAAFRFRAQRPLFDTEPFTIASDISGAAASVRAETPLGSVAMQAKAQLR